MPMLHPSTANMRTSTRAAWRLKLPTLVAPTFTLREMRPGDAMSLLTMVGTDDVSRYISPPPSTPEGFERFIDWAIRERAAGGQVCYGVVPAGMTTAVGLFQLRPLDVSFGVVEWGFALGAPYWGTGVFEDAAALVLEFAFTVVGVLRLEARAVVANGRGNGALRKIGAVQEGVLRRSFLRHGTYHDQLLWAILAEDWKQDHDRTLVVH